MPTEETKDLQGTSGTAAGSGEAPSGTGAPNKVGELDSDLGNEDLSKLPEWAVKKLAIRGEEARKLREQLRERETKDAEQAAAAKKAEEDRLAKQGEYQTLAEQRGKELEAMKARADRAAALEARIKADNDARIAKVSEKMRDMIPDYDDPVKLNEWLVKHQEKLSAPEAPKLNGGAKGEGKHIPVRRLRGGPRF